MNWVGFELLFFHSGRILVGRSSRNFFLSLTKKGSHNRFCPNKSCQKSVYLCRSRQCSCIGHSDLWGSNIQGLHLLYQLFSRLFGSDDSVHEILHFLGLCIFENCKRIVVFLQYPQNMALS